MIKPLQQRFYKLTSWLSIGAIGSIIPLSFAPPTQAQSYSDIQGHWAEECISRLSQREIVTGYPDGTFKPDDIITRAEYAALMNQAFPNVNAERSTINFVDVSPSYWGYNAIRTAYQKDFLSGYPNNEFRPENIIDRTEAFVSLASGLDYNVPNNPQQILYGTYQDAAEIPQYAEGQIAAATQQGILISPPKPQFQQRLMGPSDPATRAQIAASICEAKEIEGVPPRYVVNAQRSDGNGISFGQSCTNNIIGYQVNYPVGWQTTTGNVVDPCQIFDSGEVEIEPQTEDFDEAIYFDLENIPYNELANQDFSQGGDRLISIQTTTIDNRRATIVETDRSDSMGLGPKGRYYRYIIDYGDQALVVKTYEVSGQPYQENKQVLNRMMESINLS